MTGSAIVEGRDPPTCALSGRTRPSCTSALQPLAVAAAARTSLALHGYFLRMHTTACLRAVNVKQGKLAASAERIAQ